MRASIRAQARASIFGGPAAAPGAAARESSSAVAKAAAIRRRAGTVHLSFSFSPEIRICGSTPGLSFRICETGTPVSCAYRGQGVAILDDVGAANLPVSALLLSPGHPALPGMLAGVIAAAAERGRDDEQQDRDAANECGHRDYASGCRGALAHFQYSLFARGANRQRWMLARSGLIVGGRDPDRAGDRIAAQRGFSWSKLPRRHREGARRRRAGSASPAMLARGATRPAAGPGANAAPEQLRPAALGADPRHEEYRPRHQLPQARDVARLGRADDRAHPAQAAGAGQAIGEPVDELGEALVQRRLGGGQVLDVGGAGIAGADEGEDARPRRLGRGDERLERVAAEQRVGREGVGAEARHRSPRGRRLPDQCLRVGRGGDRDVAALAVGERRAGRPRAPPRRPRPARPSPARRGARSRRAGA